MIFVFGAILQSITLESSQDSEFAKHYHNSVGGRGALQAMAAGKTGAKIGLVGKTGDDELSKHILLRLRKHGVITSGVAKIETLQTGTAVHLTNEGRDIIALGASARSSAEQLPADLMNEKCYVLAQTELPGEETETLLEAAKEAGATTILNLAPSTDINPDNVDILIASEKNAKTLNTNAKMIVIKNDGSIEFGDKIFSAIHIEGINTSHTEGTEDAFCGTFVGSLYNGLSLEDAIQRAQVAAFVTSSRRGAYDAMPYIDEVNKILKALKEQA